MNKIDCEKIAYILADTGAPDEVCHRFFSLDARIESELNLFQESMGRSEAVDTRFIELMVEQFGNDWFVLRSGTAEIRSAVYDQARREIYGDAYHPSLFKR